MVNVLNETQLSSRTLDIKHFFFLPSDWKKNYIFDIESSLTLLFIGYFQDVLNNELLIMK